MAYRYVRPVPSVAMLRCYVTVVAAHARLATTCALYTCTTDTAAMLMYLSWLQVTHTACPSAFSSNNPPPWRARYLSENSQAAATCVAPTHTVSTLKTPPATRNPLQSLTTNAQHTLIFPVGPISLDQRATQQGTILQALPPLVITASAPSVYTHRTPCLRRLPPLKGIRAARATSHMPHHVPTGPACAR